MLLKLKLTEYNQAEQYEMKLRITLLFFPMYLKKQKMPALLDMFVYFIVIAVLKKFIVILIPIN